MCKNKNKTKDKTKTKTFLFTKTKPRDKNQKNHQKTKTKPINHRHRCRVSDAQSKNVLMVARESNGDAVRLAWHPVQPAPCQSCRARATPPGIALANA
jgi:hypothetical protein